MGREELDTTIMTVLLQAHTAVQDERNLINDTDITDSRYVLCFQRIEHPNVSNFAE